MPAYLDHAATTPIRAVALEAMTEQLQLTGNPSSLHTAGRAARRVVEESREIIAEVLGARPSEVLFTSGGTESDNIAVLGTLNAVRGWGRNRIVASAIEHHAVLDPLDHLLEAGQAHVSWAAVDRLGHVTPEQVVAAAHEGPLEQIALASVMWANNEAGTVNDIPAITSALAGLGSVLSAGPDQWRTIPVHTDASQAVGHVPVDFAASGVALMTVASHKVGGPVGAGALLAARDAQLKPIAFGGGQERSIRSGTLDAPAIRAFAAALAEAVATREEDAVRVGALRDRLIEGALALDPGITVTGCWQPGDTSGRLPGNAHLLVSGCEGDSLLYLLDAAGIACSTGSACQAGVPQPSHVVLAMGYSPEQARGAIRLTLGHTSTDADVDAFLAALPEAIARARRASGAA